MSPFRPLDRRGVFSIALAIFFLLASACTQADGPGVKVKAIASDIVFDSDAADPDAVPTLALPPATDGGFAALGGGGVRAPVESEDDEPPPPPRRPRVKAPPQAKPECPSALATAFPREAATFDVPHVPAAGEYRWKRTVVKKTMEQSGFNGRQISNVSKITETPNPATPDKPTRTFTFEETAAFEDGSSSLTGFQVRDNPPRQNVALQTGEKASTGPPDRGVAITKTVLRDSSGKIIGTFNPSTPVLILPLPVAVPTEFESVGVDPTGASYAVRGTVVGKERVDACGDVIDGWRVDSSQTFTSRDGRRHVSDVEYFVATQLGGIVIYQKAVAAEAVRGPDDPTVIDHIAQLDPTPVS